MIRLATGRKEGGHLTPLVTVTRDPLLVSGRNWPGPVPAISAVLLKLGPTKYQYQSTKCLNAQTFGTKILNAKTK